MCFCSTFLYRRRISPRYIALQAELGYSGVDRSATAKEDSDKTDRCFFPTLFGLSQQAQRTQRPYFHAHWSSGPWWWWWLCGTMIEWEATPV